MLRRYAAQNPAELFAVAVENFFERPDLMSRRHPELFAALRNIFRIDPLTWDS
jgi:Mlc titration factor MtfA (ptsG expression regulator)